ncbi:amidase [Phytomonospora sp. NPDC050363]|uniref:amidase n=1 Tax=Phytomonospora sp. NPDC050363 TaxID=3155642 RepID=UPI0033EB0789
MEKLVGHRPLAAELSRDDAQVRENIARTCDRVEAVDGEIEAFVSEPGRRERLLAEAEAAASRWPDPTARPALYGIPVGIKDIVHVDGLPTLAGSGVPAEALAGPQATVVDRLRDAGALVAGKTVTAEFAVLAPGPTRNPHDTGHTPGGSSSGSAAAVAAGMVPLAIGTQTVGSVIRPGAFCGVAAFKPTFGRIPVDGVIPNAKSFDTLGLYAADLAGIALAAPLLCDGWRAGLPEAGRPVLGVPEGPYLAEAGPEATEAFAGHVGLLEAAGFDVRRVDVLDDFEHVRATQFRVNRHELAAAHAVWYAAHPEGYREQTVKAIGEGLEIDVAEYESALAAREAIRAEFGERFAASGVDVWIAPPAPGTAPEGIATTGSAVMCLPWSFLGMPALTLPTARPEGSLPLGLQLVGAFGADEELLAFAAEVEATLDVQRR